MILNNTKSQLVCFSELQTPSPANDLTFVCEDGIVRSHQALFSWMSSFLRRFFLSKQVMEDSGKLKDEVTLFLPSVRCEAVDQIIMMVTTGSCLLQSETAKRDLSDVWGLLNIDRMDFNSLGMTQLGPDIHDKDASAGVQTEVIDLVNDEDDDDVDISPPLVKAETVDLNETTFVNVGQDGDRKKIGNHSEIEVQENTRGNHSEGAKSPMIFEKDHNKEVESTSKEVAKTKRRGRKPKSMKTKSDLKSAQENSNKSNNASNCPLSTSPADTENKPEISISKDKKSIKEANVSEQFLSSLPNINISKAPAQSQDKDVDGRSSSSQATKKSLPGAPVHYPHISITKQVRVLNAETPPLKKPQIKRPTVVKEVKNELREDVRQSMSVTLNPEETNEDTMKRNEMKEAELTDDHGNNFEPEKILRQEEQKPTHDDNVQSESVAVSAEPKIVVEGFDDVEFKHELESDEQPVYNMDLNDLVVDDNIDDPSSFTSLKKRKMSEDLVSDHSLKRRRSNRLKLAGSREGSKSKECEKKEERRSMVRASGRIYQENHNCLVCGLRLNMKDILTLKEHYSQCFYDSDNIDLPLPWRRQHSNSNGSPLNDQELKYRCIVKGCLRNMKSGNRGLFSYRDYAIHMSKDHGYLEKVIESDPREGMCELLEALKKSGHFNAGIIECRFSGCDKIFNRDSKRDLKVHYATSHLKKHFPVREETGLSPGFCREETKCRCERCEETGKKILIMAGLDDTIRHLVITHDGLKTVLENNRTEPQVSNIFNDIYGDGK